MVLDHILLSIQPQSFLKWTHTSSEQSLTDFDTILHEEYIQVALEIFEVEICSSISSPKLTRVLRDVQIW
jgi:hypothetical protein